MKFTYMVIALILVERAAETTTSESIKSFIRALLIICWWSWSIDPTWVGFFSGGSGGGEGGHDGEDWEDDG